MNRPIARRITQAFAAPARVPGERTLGLRSSRPGQAGLLLALALAAAPAWPAAVEVQVSDAAGRALPGAVVWLESREARAAVRPAQGVEVAQVNRAFVPAVTVVPVGTAVSFPNRDRVRHHVYSFSPTKKFEIKLYVGTPAEPVVFDQPGVAVLGCNIHDQMAAWVVVVPTPWHASADERGRALLADVPAGGYRLRVWHAELPVGAPAFDQPLPVGAEPVRASVRLEGVKR
jgi:plastocyanin